MPIVPLCLCAKQQVDTTYEDAWSARKGKSLVFHSDQVTDKALFSGNFPLLHLLHALLGAQYVGEAHAQMRGQP